MALSLSTVEITPEIITKIRLVVGHDKAYEIPMSDEDRANVAFLLSLISKERYSTFIPAGGGPLSQRDVLAWLGDHPGEHTAEEIAEAQGLQVRNIRKSLNALAKWREIERLQSGVRFYGRAGAV